MEFGEVKPHIHVYCMINLKMNALYGMDKIHRNCAFSLSLCLLL